MDDGTDNSKYLKNVGSESPINADCSTFSGLRAYQIGNALRCVDDLSKFGSTPVQHDTYKDPSTLDSCIIVIRPSGITVSSRNPYAQMIARGYAKYTFSKN